MPATMAISLRRCSEAGALRPAEACTNFLVTRGASVDGSTMLTYSADSHVRYGELYMRRGGTWPAGTKVALRDRGDARPLGEIPQAA